eukprot:831278-Pelagomonas_calceolata.AAC.2
MAALGVLPTGSRVHSTSKNGRNLLQQLCRARQLLPGAASMAARGVNVDAQNSRHRPGQTAEVEVAYRGLARLPCFGAPPPCDENLKSIRGPHDNPKLLAKLPAGFPGFPSLLQFGPEQGPSQKWHLLGVTEKCRILA